MRYRVNYGNGQVSRHFSSAAEAWREHDSITPRFPWASVQVYEPGTADDPGDWVRAKRPAARLPRRRKAW